MFFGQYLFKYQKNINRPATQCFLSVRNCEWEGVLDFVLDVVIIALISIFSLFFFSWKTKRDKSPTSIGHRARYVIELDKSSSSIIIFTLSPRKSERPRARYQQIKASLYHSISINAANRKHEDKDNEMVQLTKIILKQTVRHTTYG